VASATASVVRFTVTSFLSGTRPRLATLLSGRGKPILLAITLLFAGCETVEEPVGSPARDCVRPEGVANISFSATKYPNIRRHFRRAVRDGWPRVLVLRRRGADERRDDLLDAYPTREGFDRDEYPPAVGRRRAAADVAYVPSSENRSHGATLGIKLRRFCDGTRFRYVFY
jgi:hypothetical protein